MPVSIEYKESLFCIDFIGELTSGEFMDMLGAFEGEENKRAVVPHRISDLTALTDIKINFDDILSLASHRRVKNFPNMFKSAIVANNEAQMGFARMFQTLNNNPQITIRIFTDRATALLWLAPQE